MKPCILLRYGEIGLKSRRKRPYFEKLYISAIKDALQRNGADEFKIKNMGGRFIIYHHTPKDLIAVLQRVPGIQSMSIAEEIVFNDNKDLLDKLAFLKEKIKGKTFGVKVKRVGTHDFSSMEFAGELGAFLSKESAGVDLTDPDIMLYCEIRQLSCFVYTDMVNGLGGLPPKSSGKVLCLFSGGLDSPVAAFQMLRRGCEADFLFINLSGEKMLHDVCQIYNFLTSNYAFGFVPKLFVVDGNALVEKITREVKDELRQIALKIAFYQIAQAVAEQQSHLALATGESLSQKSSQTLQSLKLIESQVSIPVHRPLFAFDKYEIIKMAEAIGTAASSQKIKEYCNLSEGPVSTMPDQRCLKDIPDFTDVVTTSLSGMKVFSGIIALEEEPVTGFSWKDVVVVDMRPRLLQERHALAADLHLPYPDIMDELGRFESIKSYLLICDFGVRSEEIAYHLRKKGIKAAGISLQGFLKHIQPLLSSHSLNQKVAL